MEILPNDSLTLAEASAHLGIPMTTLRDLIRNNQLATSTQRRKSARGVRQMVVLCPDTLHRLEALLRPASAPPRTSRTSRAGTARTRIAPYARASRRNRGAPRALHSLRRRPGPPGPGPLADILPGPGARHPLADRGLDRPGRASGLRLHLLLPRPGFNRIDEVRAPIVARIYNLKEAGKK
jgi:hypothetical protein